MANKFSLQPLLDLMQTRTDEATRQLGVLIAAEQSARNRLQMLEDYRAEYAVKLRDACTQGLTPMALRNYQDFLARIDDAISQQTLAVSHSEQNTASGQENWKEQNKRLKAIDTLSHRHDLREKVIDNKQQQKIQDEHTVRKYAVRSEEQSD
ncbi:flagellar export protein FliJ [Dechloromonas sp. HYN0024]|uniref:flagellar export protein FliJ n=1 Tax=Dechloromonas sp. HYN0024 TaxID=2231055 RepID=UPI000E431B75|nr:flagellar export protein FliJ [Dechloromonas sp. HYN0024]AXS79186.1 flagellar export protein FliJ [Dechloromonas sp. HYN0024]